MLAKTFGCTRFFYNHLLQAKEAFSWLNEFSSVPLQQSLRNLQTAYKNFFDRSAGYPKFKSKHDSYQSAKFVNTAYTFRDGVLKLAKDKTPLNIRWSRQLPKAAKMTSITISKGCAYRYFDSIQVEDEVAKKKTS